MEGECTDGPRLVLLPPDHSARRLAESAPAEEAELLVPHRRRLRKSASEGVGEAALPCIGRERWRTWWSKSSGLVVEVLGLGGRSPRTQWTKSCPIEEWHPLWDRAIHAPSRQERQRAAACPLADSPCIGRRAVVDLVVEVLGLGGRSPRK